MKLTKNCHYIVVLVILIFFQFMSVAEEITTVTATYNDQCGCFQFHSNHFENPGETHFTLSTQDFGLKYPETKASDKIYGVSQSCLTISNEIVKCFMTGYVTKISGFFYTERGKYIGFKMTYTKVSKDNSGNVIKREQIEESTIQVIGLPLLWREFQYSVDLTNLSANVEIENMQLVVIPSKNGYVPVNIDELKFCRYCKGDVFNTPEVKNIEVVNSINGSVIKVLDGNNFDQIVVVPPNVNKVKFKVNHKNGQTITFNNLARESGDNIHSVSKEITIGEFFPSDISIGVKEVAECQYSEYNIRLEKENNDEGLLEGIEISPDGEIIGGFNKYYYTDPYTVIVPVGTQQVFVTPFTGLGVQSIKINGMDAQKGSEFGPISIVSGQQNMVQVQVTNYSGITRVYKFIITDLYVEWDSENLSSGLENETPEIKVRLSRAASQSVSVNYYSDDITAVNGVDYSVNSGTIVFSPGEIEKIIPGLTITNDNLSKAPRSFSLNLDKCINSIIKEPASFVYTINDDDKFSIEFDKTSIIVDEAKGEVEIPVHIDNYSNLGDYVVSAKVNVDNSSTASQKTDYEIIKNDLYWGNCLDCPNIQYVRIKIIDDDIIETIKNLKLVLEPLDGTVAGTNSQCNIQIVDNDSYSISFTSEGDEVNMIGLGQTQVDVDVQLNQCIKNSDEKVSVQVNFSGTAIAGTDFIPPISNSLEWTYDGCQGDLKKKIHLVILSRAVSKVIEINLSLIVGGKIVSPSTYTILITNKNIIYVDNRYVPINTPEYDSIDGKTWKYAFIYLQDALKEAAENPGIINEIRVAAGVYYPDKGNNISEDDPRVSFIITDGTIIKGGYPAGGGDEASRIVDIDNPNRHKTILSGFINGENDVSLDDNSSNIIQGNCFTLDGLTITGGYARPICGGDPYAGGTTCKTSSGGAIYSPDIANIRMTNCEYTVNKGEIYEGGAAISIKGGILNIDHCKFENNHMDVGNGGVIHAFNNSTITIMNSYFTNNTATNGGVLYCNGSQSNVMINNSKFESNHAYGNGGVIYYKGTIKLDDCIFNWNTTWSNGGVICGYENEQFSAKNVLFANNSGISGGVIHIYKGEMQMVNSVFNGNTASEGGCIYSSQVSSSFINCTFNNLLANKGCVIYIYGMVSPIQFKNSIFWTYPQEHESPIFFKHDEPFAVELINCWNQNEHTTDDVPFVNVSQPIADLRKNDGLNLRTGSLCINTGAAVDNKIFPTIFGVPVDITNRPRIDSNSGLIDIGAYEKQ